MLKGSFQLMIDFVFSFSVWIFAFVFLTIFGNFCEVDFFPVFLINFFFIADFMFLLLSYFLLLFFINLFYFRS
jgi:hypothetical protein